MNTIVTFSVFLLLGVLAAVSAFPANQQHKQDDGLYIRVKEEGKDKHQLQRISGYGMAAGVEEEEEQRIEEEGRVEEAEEEERGIRIRRATCDLLSFSVPWGSLNHSACAAHCLAMRRGYRGGRCRDGVCHCRR